MDYRKKFLFNYCLRFVFIFAMFNFFKNMGKTINTKFTLIKIFFIFFSCFKFCDGAEIHKIGDNGLFLNPSINGIFYSKNWKTLRDERIVKQNLDYSCGAASLATLLNEFYGQAITEEALLKAMDKGDLRASFEDMQNALPQFGFKAEGFAASYEQLMKLKAPVVVYLKHRKDDHFSVLRGIDENTVWLADPSLGNRTYSKEQFLEMWETRKDKDNAELAGKFLAVLPSKEKFTYTSDFFTKKPERQTAQAVEQLNFSDY